jgi:hypothetical protein
MTYKEEKVNRIAAFITITADLFDGKSDYVYDPEHKMSKAEVERKVDGPADPTSKGWSVKKNKDKNKDQMDLFGDVPPSIIETNPDVKMERSVDLFGRPVPKAQEILPPSKEEPITPPATVVQPKPDLEGQTMLPIEAPTPSTTPATTETPPPPPPAPVTAPAPKPIKQDPDGLKKAVKAISRHFNAPKVLEKVPKGMLSTIGGNITKFEPKGVDAELTVNSASGAPKKLVIKHDATPINDMDKDMQAMHTVGSSWAIASGLADDQQFQSDAQKAWTKDLDNFVSKFTDLPYPGEEFKTYSPANWIVKGKATPKLKGAFYTMFARGLPSTGDKGSLMVRSFLGAMQTASDGDYGFGYPQQTDNDPSTKVANMAGFVAQGMANDSGFMKKNMPLTTNLFASKMI